MQKESLKATLTRKELKTMQLKYSIPVRVDEDFLNKVKYLCQHISDEEWSGVLYYEVTGTVSDITSFSVVLKDICPMHKGNSVHTNFEYGEDIIDYQMSNPKLNITPKGLIHSHNKMGVFFSKEDQEEIEDNAEFYNYYLSVVVNNNLNFAMRLSFLGSLTVKGKNEKGEEYTIESSEQVLFVYPCHIIETETIFSVGDVFKQRVETIKSRFVEEKKKQEKIKFAKSSTPANTHSHFITSYSNPSTTNNKFIVENEQKVELEDETDERNLELFIIAILLKQFGEKVVTDALDRGDTIGDALAFLNKFFKRNTIDITAYCANLINQFFSNHFDMYGESTFEDIMSDFDDIDAILADYVDKYAFVANIMESLNQLSFNYQILEINEE